MCIPSEACSRITFCDRVFIRLLKFQYCVHNQDFRNNTSSFRGRKFRSSKAYFFFLSGSLILLSAQNLSSSMSNLLILGWATLSPILKDPDRHQNCKFSFSSQTSICESWKTKGRMKLCLFWAGGCNSSLPSQRMDQKPSEELRTGKDVRA